MKNGLYKRLKIGGLLSFLPFVMAAGPLAGFFAGDYLIKRFNFPAYTSYVLAGLGFLGSLRETVRVIRITMKMDGEEGLKGE